MIRFLVKSVNYIMGPLLQKKHLHINASLEYLERTRTIDKNYLDYIRLSALELAAHEIDRKQLNGNVAELGVYKGKFARYMNQYFANRTLYLLDTFEGFDSRDTEKERKESFSTGNQDFSDTSEEAVLSIMPHRQQCKIIKGFFPESAKNLNDTFVFVSLDTDLYEPLYNGLHFFYPKLVQGGYIFVHDFNNDAYKGARQAVMQFCQEQQINYTPIPDSGGSCIITK